MEEVAKLISGKEIELEELKTLANQAQILKVKCFAKNSFNSRVMLQKRFHHTLIYLFVSITR